MIKFAVAGDYLIYGVGLNNTPCADEEVFVVNGYLNCGGVK